VQRGGRRSTLEPLLELSALSSVSASSPSDLFLQHHTQRGARSTHRGSNESSAASSTCTASVADPRSTCDTYRTQQSPLLLYQVHRVEGGVTLGVPVPSSPCPCCCCQAPPVPFGRLRHSLRDCGSQVLQKVVLLCTSPDTSSCITPPAHRPHTAFTQPPARPSHRRRTAVAPEAGRPVSPAHLQRSGTEGHHHTVRFRFGSVLAEGGWPLTDGRSSGSSPLSRMRSCVLSSRSCRKHSRAFAAPQRPKQRQKGRDGAP